MYPGPSRYSRGLEGPHLPIVGNPPRGRGGEISEDGHIIPVADDSEAYSPVRESLSNAGTPSFGFEVASFERGIPPPSRFLMNDLLASVEIIPFEEGENSPPQ